MKLNLTCCLAWPPVKRVGQAVLIACLILLGACPLIAADQTLTGHVPKAVVGLTARGRLPADNRLELSLELPLQNRDGLVHLIEQIYDPTSTNFHAYLKPEQFATRFGPAVQDYEAVQAFVRSRHLVIENTFSNRALLVVSGRVADIENAFQVTLHVYQHPKEDREFFAPDVEPKIDASLPALKIGGLDNFNLPRPAAHHALSPDHLLAGIVGGGSGPNGYYIGYDFRNAYAPGVTLTGAGQTVALFELDGFYPNDITQYENIAGLPHIVPTVIAAANTNGFPTTNAAAVGEVSLDIESVIAMAPGASSVLVYEGNNTASILTRIAQDDLAQQISSSWFFGRASTNDTELLQMAAQGQTFFQCSGDDLAYVNGINFGPNSGPPADDPYLVSVGATDLTNAVDKSWLSESSWNNGDGINGSGGGISTVYGIPAWQQGVSMSSNGGSTTKRNIPDVAMVGDKCFFVSNNGNTNGFWWGTSIAAPLWAGYNALINQQAAATGKPAVGFLNPAIYALAEGQGYNTYFHDITVGNNTWSNSPSSFFTATGYDLCTGWGTPTGSNVINALASFGGPVFVNFGYSGSPQNGAYNTPYQTLIQATNAVATGGTIIFETSGSSPSPMTISKPMAITSMGGPVSVGN